MKNAFLALGALMAAGVGSAHAQECTRVGMEMMPVTKTGADTQTFEIRTNTVPVPETAEEAIIVGRAKIHLRFPDGSVATQWLMPVVKTTHGKSSQYCKYFIQEGEAEVVGATVSDAECLAYYPTYASECG